MRIPPNKCPSAPLSNCSQWRRWLLVMLAAAITCLMSGRGSHAIILSRVKAVEETVDGVAEAGLNTTAEIALEIARGSENIAKTVFEGLGKVILGPAAVLGTKQGPPPTGGGADSAAGSTRLVVSGEEFDLGKEDEFYSARDFKNAGQVGHNKSKSGGGVDEDLRARYQHQSCGGLCLTNLFSPCRGPCKCLGFVCQVPASLLPPPGDGRELELIIPENMQVIVASTPRYPGGPARAVILPAGAEHSAPFRWKMVQAAGKQHETNSKDWTTAAIG